MKERIIWGGVGVAGGLLLRAAGEYVIFESDWPQYARDFALGFLQNPVIWAICGSMGALVGWHVPEAFRRSNTRPEAILRENRGSARTVLLGVAAVLAIGIGGGFVATEFGQPALKAVMGFPRGMERVVSGIGASLNYPGR